MRRTPVRGTTPLGNTTASCQGIRQGGAEHGQLAAAVVANAAQALQKPADRAAFCTSGLGTTLSGRLAGPLSGPRLGAVIKRS